ncbi:hypothetical protein TNCV_2270671 [Trichonephila clavipes]|nr:hypothetical protein TNCV_2270671 [Trichonephila clavipes]
MSSFLVLSEGNTRNRWRDGQVCPDVGQGTMAPWARRLGNCGRSSLVVKVMDSWPTCHEFEPSTAEGLPCRGAMLHLSRVLKRPPVGVKQGTKQLQTRPGCEEIQEESIRTGPESVVANGAALARVRKRN